MPSSALAREGSPGGWGINYNVRSKSNFVCKGCLSTRSREGVDQLPPPRSPNTFQPAALRDVPGSVFRMYVMSRRYPISRAIRQQAPYNMLQVFGSPVLQRRITSAVKPSCKRLATGLPTIATPTIFPFHEAAIWNIEPTGLRPVSSRCHTYHASPQTNY